MSDVNTCSVFITSSTGTPFFETKDLVRRRKFKTAGSGLYVFLSRISSENIRPSEHCQQRIASIINKIVTVSQNITVYTIIFQHSHANRKAIFAKMSRLVESAD